MKLPHRRASALCLGCMVLGCSLDRSPIGSSELPASAQVAPPGSAGDAVEEADAFGNTSVRVDTLNPTATSPTDAGTLGTAWIASEEDGGADEEAVDTDGVVDGGASAGASAPTPVAEEDAQLRAPRACALDTDCYDDEICVDMGEITVCAQVCSTLERCGPVSGGFAPICQVTAIDGSGYCRIACDASADARCPEGLECQDELPNLPGNTGTCGFAKTAPDP